MLQVAPPRAVTRSVVEARRRPSSRCLETNLPRAAPALSASRPSYRISQRAPSERGGTALIVARSTQLVRHRMFPHRMSPTLAVCAGDTACTAARLANGRLELYHLDVVSPQRARGLNREGLLDLARPTRPRR